MLADLRRRDRDGLQCELDDAIAPCESLSNRLDVVSGHARAHGHAESHELQDARRRLPALEVGQLVRAEDEDCVRRTSLLECVDGACVEVELDGSLRDVRERQLREFEPRVGLGRGALVAWVCDDEDEELLEPELADRRASESHVAEMRRIEDSAEDAYCHSSASSPTSTCAPRLMPSLRSASSSSSAGGGVPTTR